MTAGVIYKALLLAAFVVGCCSFSMAQQRTSRYIIISKNDSVGNMQVSQKTSGDDIVYSLASVVEMKMLMTIKVNVQEQARYHKEKLISSLSRRIINDKPKANKQTKATIDGYIITDDGKENRLALKNISYDFLRLYFKEPIAISQIYSDYYQRMLSVKPTGNHTYQIDLPEGGPNTYHYENGICRKVDIRGTLFNAQMIISQ